MNLADRRRAERPARVWGAPRIALVRCARPMVDVPLPSTVVAAAAQLTVERVKDVRVERSYLDGANQRPNVLVRVADIGRERAALQSD